MVEIVLPNKLSRVGGGECVWARLGGWEGVAESSQNKANLSQPSNLELGLGLSFTIDICLKAIKYILL